MDSVQFYPLSFLPIYPITSPVTFNPEYINNLEALGVLDFYTPSIFASSPLFAQVNSFNQNIGILQTAYNSLEKIYTLIDTLKQINNPTEDVIKTFENEIDKIIQNTTFNNIDVFNQKVDLNGLEIDLTLPSFSYENLDNYTQAILDKEELIKSALESNLSPFNSTYHFNPINSEEFFSLLNSGTLLSAYNTNLITPEIVQLLLS